MSKILDMLYHEHQVITEFIGKLKLMCMDFMVHDKIDIKQFYKAVEFIKTYADGRHHQKEEEILFKAMTDKLGVQAVNLITHGMLVEHDLARYHVKELEKSIKEYEETKSDEAKLNIITFAMGYYYLLERHVFKENKVVYPFGEKNLSSELMEELDKQAVIYEEKYADQKIDF